MSSLRTLLFAFAAALIGSPASGQFRATPNPLVFPDPSNTTNPFATRFFTLFSDNPSSVSFTYTAQTLSGGNWLTVAPIGATTPAPVGVSVNTAGLATGFYQGTITFSGGSFAPYQVQVQLSVGTGGGGSSFTLSPSNLQFSSVQNGSAQTQNVTLSATSAVSYTAFVTSQGGASTSWLSVSPQSGNNVTFASLGVTANPVGLGIGTYQGQISVIVGATTQTIFATLAVSQTLTISTASQLPAGTSGIAYTQTLTANGGSGAGYTWALVIGSTLPSGLTLSSAGVLSGTPTVSGAFAFAIQVTDSANHTATRQFLLGVAPASNLSITSATLATGTVATAYPATALQATGGSGVLTWAIVAGSGQFPPGLTFSTSGIIAGTPTSPGTFGFSVQVLDSQSNLATAGFTITINAISTLSIITTSLPNGTVDTTYSQTLAAIGGSAPLRWSLVSGSLPTGLTLGSASGVISGLPSAASTFDFTVQVQDSANFSATQRYFVTVFIAPRILTLFLPGGSINLPYIGALQGTGGEPPYTWSQNGLPDGLTLDVASGAISGSPVRADTYDVTITLRDSANRIATGHFSIVVQRGSLQTGLSFVALPPCRIMETRPEYNFDGRTGAFGPPFLAANETRTLLLPASNVCQIPASAKALVLNVTVVPRGPVDFVTVFPADEARPGFWTIRSPDAQIVANAAIVRAGPGGAIKVFSSNTADILIDIAGYFTDSRAVSNLVFYPIAPCRVIDTRTEYRTPAGPFGPPTMNTRETRRFRFPATPYCPVPTGAAAYSVTTTVAPAQSLAYLTTWPSGTAQPIVSSINSFAGRILANSVIVPASSDGSIDVFAFDRTDLIVDINGYFAPDDGVNGLLYFPLTQCRASDSSDSSYTGTFGGPIYGDESTRSIQILTSPRCVAIPVSAKGYAVNVTALPAGSPMPYLTVYPTGQSRPIASMLNAFQGQVVTNSAIVPAGAGGAIDVFTYRRTNVVVEISGYFGR